MARIFISYSRADRQFIDQVVPLIRRVYGNDSVWFDDDIHGGVDWWQMILNEIEKCDIFVYLISNESLESPYCQAELHEALRLKKQILPVIVRRLKPDYPGNIDPDLAAVLRRTQYVDMSGGFRDANTIASLYAALTRLLNAIPQQPSNPVTLTPTPQPPVPDKKKSDPNICAAYIGGGFVLVAAIIAGIFGLWQEYFANPPSDPTTAVVQNITETPTDALTSIATYISTATLTNMPAATTTPPPDPVQAAFTPVTRNDDWTPVERDFDGVTMVLVPTGCFMMGSDGGDGDEKPITKTCIDEAFWIDRYEVSNKQFLDFGGRAVNSSRWTNIPNRPRESITWFEARDYCILRGGRLPTEAEWEFAARGPDSSKYPWNSDEFESDRLVYRDNSDFRTAPIGSRTEGDSWVGASDLSGNVWEWVSSIYHRYPYDPEDGRENMQPSYLFRVRRGGSYYNSQNFLERTGVAERQADEPSIFKDDLGFRCARSFE